MLSWALYAAVAAVVTVVIAVLVPVTVSARDALLFQALAVIGCGNDI